MSGLPLNENLHCMYCRANDVKMVKKIGKYFISFCSDNCYHKYMNNNSLLINNSIVSEDRIVKIKPGINLNNHEFTKEEMGNFAWGYLHSTAEYYPDEPEEEEKKDMIKFLDGFVSTYPCYICRQHFRPIYTNNPPNVNSRKELKCWVSTVHNIVNTALGKKMYEYGECSPE